MLSSKNDPKKHNVPNKSIKKRGMGGIEKLEISRLISGSRKKI